MASRAYPGSPLQAVFQPWPGPTTVHLSEGVGPHAWVSSSIGFLPTVTGPEVLSARGEHAQHGWGLSRQGLACQDQTRTAFSQRSDSSKQCNMFWGQ